MKGKLKVLLVAGARPNFVKLAPLWREMRRAPEGFQPIIVHTGQHYDQRMSQIFFEELELPEPDVHLGVGSASHAQQTARIMTGFEKVMFETEPDWVIVFGDVNSTTAAALVAAKERFKVAHVEAGLRSFDRTMPEELNRIVTDHLSDLLFTSCSDADDNLARESIEERRIHFVGNIMIDSLLSALPRSDKSEVLQILNLRPGGYALVTLHRPGNVDGTLSLLNLTEMLCDLSERLPVVFPVHPRTHRNLEAAGLISTLTGRRERICLTEPLGYIDFLKLEKEARLVLTDSGGVQEETTMLNVPCLTMRENTERPVTITQGTNKLVGTDKNAILKSAESVLHQEGRPMRRPPLWDGKTAKRICEVLRRVESEELIPDQQLQMIAD